MSQITQPRSPFSAISTADYAGKHLVVFDGECVLCNGFAGFIAKHDRDDRFRFTAAQSPLGDALFRSYGLATDVYETNLVIIDGAGHQRLEGFIEAMSALGWPWRMAQALRLLPKAVRAWLYSRIASNRYAWFGRRDRCDMPSKALRDRLIA